MEYLNQVNEKGEVVGKVSREEAHNNFILHEAVQIFVFDDGGKVLVQKRSKEKDVFAGDYEIGVSGHVAFEEIIEKAAQRELKEEVCIEVEKGLKKAGSFRVEERPENEIIFLFVLEGYEGKIKKSEEVSWARFISVEKMEKMMKKEKFTPTSRKGWTLYRKRY